VYFRWATAWRGAVFMDALKKKRARSSISALTPSPPSSRLQEGFVQAHLRPAAVHARLRPHPEPVHEQEVRLGPMNLDTGAGFVDAKNYQNVANGATKGYR